MCFVMSLLHLKKKITLWSFTRDFKQQAFTEKARCARHGDRDKGCADSVFCLPECEVNGGL